MLKKLYKKKVIRNFISLYNEKYWTQLITNLLEYGIILFKKTYTISSLSPEDISSIIETFKKEENIYDTINSSSPSKCTNTFISKHPLLRSSNSNTNINKPPKSNYKKQTLTHQHSTDMITFNSNIHGNNNSKQNTINKHSKTKSKRKAFSKGMNSNKIIKGRKSNNSSNTSSRKNIFNMTQHSNMESKHNKNNTSVMSEYSCYMNDNNMKMIKQKNGKILTYKNNNDEKLNHFEGNDNKQSKMQTLIDNDKKTFLQQQKYRNLSGTFKPLSIDNTNVNINKEDECNGRNKCNSIKNESSIISLENKLNGLTMKLSKLNASIQNNSTLSMNNNINQILNNNNTSTILTNPSYLQRGINYHCDNLELNIGNTSLHSTNQYINTTEGNNNEDYLKKFQLDIGKTNKTSTNIPNNNIEMRYYD